MEEEREGLGRRVRAAIGERRERERDLKLWKLRERVKEEEIGEF